MIKKICKHLREILVVINYDLKIFFRYKTNLLWLIVTPIVFLGIGVILYKLIGAEDFALYTGGAESSGMYVIIGYAMFSLANYSYHNGGKVEVEIMTGTAKTNFLLPINRSSYIYGLSISTIISTGIFTLIMLLGSMFFINMSLHQICFSVVFLLLSTIIFLGISLIISSIGLLVKRIGNISNMFTFMLQVITGLIIPIRIFPGWLQNIFNYFPTTIAIDSVRSMMMGLTPLMPFKTELIMLIIYALVINVIGIYVLRLSERKMLERGLIESY